MAKQPSAIELAQNMASIKHQLPIFLEHNTMKAKMLWAYYNDLVKEGFTETQALEIVKARGLD